MKLMKMRWANLFYFLVLRWVDLCCCLVWGWRIWQSPAHFISSPRPTPRKKKRPRMSKEGLSCWEASPRTILSSANQGHWRGKQHTLKDNHPSCPKQKDQHSETAMGAWWRSNSRRGCHLRIKCPQLTVWPH